MDKFKRLNQLPLYFIYFIYSILLLISIKHCYFWDNIQQTSKEAIWFFENNFSSLLLPDFSINAPITGTGYHPPLIGLLTALLWKIFGMKIWVSHVFIFIVIIILIYNTYLLAKAHFSSNLAPWFTLLVLIDSTILAQFSISSPDIILLTAFVTALRAIKTNKKMLLAFSLIFLGLINGRGMFATAILFIFYIYNSANSFKQIISYKFISKNTLPFLPVFILLISYFAFYFLNRSWFSINDKKFPWSAGWQNPDTILHSLKNVISYGIRILENSRVFIYSLLFIVLIKFYLLKKKPLKLTKSEYGELIIFSSFFLLYLYFAFTTINVISSRYYMPMNFIAFLFTFSILERTIKSKQLKQTTVLLAVLLLLGNFWIYPEKRTNFWDGTLAHMSFYPLREECLDYIDKNSIELKKVSAGFCLYDNQHYIDLLPSDRIISKSIQPQTEYFLYSNISDIGDEFIDELNDKTNWEVIREFRKGFVFIKVLKKVN
ncbi:MAG: hypothetical protein PHS59_00495 [Paludibacter sp.]|nr:hypothetical protein [Paludibacter sp.]